MSTARRFTSADLPDLPQRDGVRYEIIDGELHVSTQPSWGHQFTGGLIFRALQNWSDRTGAGFANLAPGVIFDPADDVAPDVVWISRDRLARQLDEAGHVRTAPELVVEILSPGVANERRDRQVKLQLYASQEVDEYWIVDWRAQTIQVYRRAGAALLPTATLTASDRLTTPLLPGFEPPVRDLCAPSIP
jgi:Uma2 family endonuclease